MSTLSEKQATELRRRKQELVAEFARLQKVIRGSGFERYSVCSRPACRCHRGEKHGPRHYVAVTQGKRQRQHYIPKAQVAAVQEGIRQYHRFLALLDTITVINLQLMKAGKLVAEE